MVAELRGAIPGPQLRRNPTIGDFPDAETSDLRWLDFDDVRRRGLRVDAIVADLGCELEDGPSRAWPMRPSRGPGAGSAIRGRDDDGADALSACHPTNSVRCCRRGSIFVVRRAVRIGPDRSPDAGIPAVLAVVALIVRLDSPVTDFLSADPYRPARSPFRMIKFRTMFVGVPGPVSRPR